MTITIEQSAIQIRKADVEVEQTAVKPGMLDLAQKPTELHGAAAKAVVDPEEAMLDLAPPGADHEAFTAHDEAVNASHKAIVAMERAKGPAPKTEAVHGIFDAAKGHKGVARQMDALASHLHEHQLVGAPKARSAAHAHRLAATALEKAAITGKGDDYARAHDAVGKTEVRAKALTETLQEQVKKKAAEKHVSDRKTAAEAKKAEKVAKAASPELRIDAGVLDLRKAWGRDLLHHAPAPGTSGWAKWDAEHQSQFRRGFSKSLTHESHHAEDSGHKAGMEHAARMVKEGAEPAAMHKAAATHPGTHGEALHHAADRFDAARESAARSSGADRPPIPKDRSGVGKFAAQDRQVMDKAETESAGMSKGKLHTGSGEMSDKEYAAHRDHVEYETARHGANDLERSPFSTHNSEDRVNGVEGKYTKERQALHQKILDEYDAKASSVPSEHKAVIMGGLGGAGKSSILRHEAESPGSVAGKLGLKYDTYDRKGDGVGDVKNFVTINPDDIKERMADLGAIPKIDSLSPMEASSFAHEEASMLAERVSQRLQARGTNVVHDITLNSVRSGEKRILGDPAKNVKGLKSSGYHVSGVMVDVSTAQSLANAEKRHRGGQDRFTKGIGEGGRYVPSDLIRGSTDPAGQYRSANRAAFETLKSAGRFDKTLTIDNEKYAGKVVDETGTTRSAEITLVREERATSEVTTQMEAYHEGRMTFPALAAWIAHYPFGVPSYYVNPGRTLADAESQDWVQPGTWSEVVNGADQGLISDGELAQLSDAVDAMHSQTSATQRSDVDVLDLRDWTAWNNAHHKWTSRDTKSILGVVHEKRHHKGDWTYGAHIHNGDTVPSVIVTRAHQSSQGMEPMILKQKSGGFSSLDEAKAYAEKVIAEDNPPLKPPREGPGPKPPRAAISYTPAEGKLLRIVRGMNSGSNGHMGIQPTLTQKQVAAASRSEDSDVDPKVPIDPGVLDTRDWAKWNAEHPRAKHPRQKHDVAAESAHRPGKLPVKKWVAPPDPTGQSGRKAGGFTAVGITNTALGDAVENALIEHMGMTDDHPGRRQGPLDVIIGKDGYEVKAVSTSATEYKAKPKKAEVERKLAYAKEQGIDPHVMVVVYSPAEKQLYVYSKPGIGAYRLTGPENGWSFHGTVPLDLGDNPDPAATMAAARAAIEAGMLDLRNWTEWDEAHHLDLNKDEMRGLNHWVRAFPGRPSQENSDPGDRDEHLGKFETEMHKMALTGQRSETDDPDAKAAHAFVDAVGSHSVPSDEELHRGLGLSPEDADRLFAKGRSVELPVSSWTSKVDTAAKFGSWSADPEENMGGKKGDKIVVLHVPKGTPAWDIHRQSTLSDETERVLGGKFKVSRVEEGTAHVYDTPVKVTHVHLEPS